MRKLKDTALLTPWGEAFSEDSILPEYPRPQMRRDSCLCLNGPWEYAVTDKPGCPKKFDGTILVPFSPESALSGVQKLVEPDDFLWYRRKLLLPKGFDRGRILLQFGAVDCLCEVFVDGVLAGSHAGGFLPFAVELTGRLKEGIAAELTLCVRDFTDTSFYSRGKQSLKPGGIWYTPQSGIWQTVFLESVPHEYVECLRLTPLYDTAAVRVEVRHNGTAAHVRVLDAGQAVAEGEGKESVTLHLPGFTPWSPKNPHLYDVEVRVGDDVVRSYFGMRKIEARECRDGRKRLYLNNEPVFLSGVLDQGYWPDGLLTAPSDEALVHDIQAMKDMGFNLLRKHIKIEAERWYYHCDRLGMLVMQDMVNGGGEYSFGTVTLNAFVNISRPDSNYARFSREEEEGRRDYERELEETIAHLYSHPCIISWVPFNEGWGQFDALKACERARALDPTRLIDHASGWHDQGGGDFKSAHIYFRRLTIRPDHRVGLISEFGGYALNIPGHTQEGRKFGYRLIKDKGALSKALARLYRLELFPLLQKGVSAAVYTQLCDVEGEINGLLTYDRKALKVVSEDMLQLQEELYRENAKLCL